jgi:hypothetical protein
VQFLSQMAKQPQDSCLDDGLGNWGASSLWSVRVCEDFRGPNRFLRACQCQAQQGPALNSIRPASAKTADLGIGEGESSPLTREFQKAHPIQLSVIPNLLPSYLCRVLHRSC